MPSLCDTCKSPGYCCRRIHLYGGGIEDPSLLDEDVADKLAEYEEWEESNGNEFPFVVFGRGESGSVLVTCPKLGNDGRCTIYERRPTLCRNYEPKSDTLCVHYGDSDG